MAVSSPLFVLALLSGGVSLVCGALISRCWQKPGAEWFVVCVIGGACWTFGYAGGLLVAEPSVRWVFEIPIWVGHGIAPVAFFVFVFQYTGRIESLSPSRHVLLWTIPVLTILITLTNDSHGLMWANYEVVPTFEAATVHYDKGPWLYVHKAYSYVLIGIAAGALVQMILVRDALYTIQSALLVTTTIPFAVSSLVWVFGLGPYPQISFTPLLFGLVFAGATLALFRSSIFDSAPAARRVGKRRVIDDFDDGVLLLDDTDRIVDANAAAQRVLETDHESLVGHPVTEILSEVDSQVSPGRFTIQLETVTGHRSYEVTISPISDDRDTLLGHSLVFHDVTDETRRRQRLTVLNRVIRHNLRNDLNIIQSYATQLETGLEEPHDELASIIVEQSTELASVGEKARRIERTLDVPDGAPRQVSLTELVSDTVERYDEDDASLIIDTSDLEVVTYQSLLETVFEDIVENAVTHGGSHPTVRITSRRSDSDTVTLTVTDDGPGIPETELVPIDAGTETPLEHTSGLGVWLITWGASQLGGSATFDRLETGGTSVQLRLPVALERERVSREY